MEHLSNNFTLDEFTNSQTAIRNGIDNSPTPEVLENLKTIAEQLENIRNLLGTPILISSGYRCPELNALVKGAKNSQHLLGQAVDFTSPKFGTPKQIVEAIRNSNIEYDQIILEFDRWVHFSYKKSGNKLQALVIDTAGTRALG